ncbi:MAG: phosphoenolpyruvate--protein phosphotransferase, partial [Agathobacter sp.]|nr:phosphoenolpyruvate--protein phosphotransferase [Agathobacter sp.]
MEKFRKVLKGDGVSLGIAQANSYLYEPSELMTSPIPFEEGMEQKYQKQLEETLMKAKEELRGLYVQMMGEQQENGGIFLSHQAILEDVCLVEEIRKEIQEHRAFLDRAIRLVMDRHIEAFLQSEDSLLVERAGDLRDVQKRLIRIWQGKPDHNLRDIKEDVIVVAYDLLPSEIAQLSQEHVKGIVTEIGGETSHCAILARCYGIPAVLGVKHAMRRVGENTPLILDALAGEVLVWPSEEDEFYYRKKLERFLQQYESERQYLDQQAETKDGTAVWIGINIGTGEIVAEDSWYDYVGLLRSEFLYMDRGGVPTEEEEVEAYKKILLQAAGKVVT